MQEMRKAALLQNPDPKEIMILTTYIVTRVPRALYEEFYD